MSKKATKVKTPEVKEETVSGEQINEIETTLEYTSSANGDLLLANTTGIAVLPDGKIYRVDTKTQESTTLGTLRMENYRLSNLVQEIENYTRGGYGFLSSKTELRDEKLYKVVDNDQYQIWMDESSIVDLSVNASDSPWCGFPRKDSGQKATLYVLNSRVAAKDLDTDFSQSCPHSVVINMDLETTTLVSSVVGSTLDRNRMKTRSIKNSNILLKHGGLNADHIENADLLACSGNIKGSIRDSELERCYFNTSNYSSISGCRLDNVNISARSFSLGKHTEKGYWARMPMKDFHFHDDSVDLEINRAFEQGKTGAGLGRFEILFFPVRKDNKIQILLQSQSSNEEYITPTTYIDLDESRMSIREKVTAILFPKKAKKRDEDGLHNRAMRNSIEASIIDEAVGVLHGRVSLINQSRLMATI
ncbi:hypothetical protein [Vibrio phage pTD1]|uniref:Uncharacterized protein n=1 Tax=Vibrio phage pTD1 TaxID=1938577 RepID=A0A1Q2U2Q4_9CAUD|nr:hypothetical protein FDH33_gp036 [Vibrio phage pTD1]BAW98245.1 hypothetical protein [Vibrio phage pTD1]